MKKHYDFSNAKHESKFYRHFDKLVFPPYANLEVIERERIAAMKMDEKTYREIAASCDPSGKVQKPCKATPAKKERRK
jgi:hypothetical protein